MPIQDAIAVFNGDISFSDDTIPIDGAIIAPKKGPASNCSGNCISKVVDRLGLQQHCNNVDSAAIAVEPEMALYAIS